jgi:hypothetical protein
MWSFVNAFDSLGNTALHMAVIHGRRDVVDWILTLKEGRDGLHLLNYHGLTPLTLAAYEGNVEMFEHILYTHLSTVAWRYGRVSRSLSLSYTHARTNQHTYTAYTQQSRPLCASLSFVLPLQSLRLCVSRLLPSPLPLSRFLALARSIALGFTLSDPLCLSVSGCLSIPPHGCLDLISTLQL